MGDIVSAARQLIYIAGTGRTGSTLLGQCLSCSGEALFAGEITHVWKRGFVEDELCGCGSPVSQCSFWCMIAESMHLNDSASRHRVAKLRDQVSQFWRLPRVALGQRLNTIDDQAYCRIYRHMTEALATTSGRPVIVDSSKYPTDLAVLASGGLPLQVVHLVRDCRAVVFAWKKRKLRREIHWRQQYMPRYSTWRTAIAWRVFNRLIPRIAQQFKLNYQLVRYEQLMAGFPESLQDLQAELGMTSTNPSPSHQANVHHIAANPCRFEFNPQGMYLDEEWKSQLSSLDRWIVRLVGGRQQREYGY